MYMTDIFGSILEKPVAFTRVDALDKLPCIGIVLWTTLETVFFPRKLHCIALRVSGSGACS